MEENISRFPCPAYKEETFKSMKVLSNQDVHLIRFDDSVLILTAKKLDKTKLRWAIPRS